VVLLPLTVRILMGFRASLEKVAGMARSVADNVVSVGASLARVHVPGRSASDAPEDAFKSGVVEVGMGIHNE
jgi:dihydroxyacetone kinase